MLLALRSKLFALCSWLYKWVFVGIGGVGYDHLDGLLCVEVNQDGADKVCGHVLWSSLRNRYNNKQIQGWFIKPFHITEDSF